MRKIKFGDCLVDNSKKLFQPRSETEFWVGEVVRKIKGQKISSPVAVLDIFSGTGCIGVALLKIFLHRIRKMDFVDISNDAIQQTEINLKLNKIPKKRYKIYKSNLFEKLKNKKYDFIFANPPYVALDRIGEIQGEVLKKEPKVALFAGRDGMVIIKKFLHQAKKHLKTGGKIFMEFDPKQTEKIKKIWEKERLGFAFKKDQFGKLRWLEVKIH